jgi:aryl-alcohol dehydrogenase-like predicted oxidoreductase
VHTAENIRAGVEHSLRQLRTDYLDIVQFHRSLTREQFNVDGALSELLTLRDEGKVRFVGVSALLPTLDEQIATGVFDVFQLPYSALQRDYEGAMTRAAAAGAGIIVRGGVARGAPDDWDARSYYMVSNEAMQYLWERAQLDDLLEGMSRTGFMLRFTISNPDLDTTIVGTSTETHLRSNLAAAARGPLAPDIVAEAKRRLDSASVDHAGGDPR